MNVPAVGGLGCLMSQVLVRYPDPYYVVKLYSSLFSFSLLVSIV